MDTTRNENVISALREEGNLLREKKMGETAGIIPALSRVVNSFATDFDALLTEIAQEPAINYQFQVLGAACMIYAGYTQLCEEKHNGGYYDGRNKASWKYCYEHLEDLFALFRSLTGSMITQDKNPKYQYFLDDFFCTNEEYRSMLRMEVTKFAQEHPTLQQKLIAMFTKSLSARCSRFDADIQFPFI